MGVQLLAIIVLVGLGTLHAHPLQDHGGLAYMIINAKLLEDEVLDLLQSQITPLTWYTNLPGPPPIAWRGGLRRNRAPSPCSRPHFPTSKPLITNSLDYANPPRCLLHAQTIVQVQNKIQTIKYKRLKTRTYILLQTTNTIPQNPAKPHRTHAQHYNIFAGHQKIKNGFHEAELNKRRW